MTTILRSVSVLAALIALLIAGTAAVQGEPTKAPLVNALGAAELGKFAVVDLADALDRVAGPARASDAAK
jgi:hypothetical protein